MLNSMIWHQTGDVHFSAFASVFRKNTTEFEMNSKYLFVYLRSNEELEKDETYTETLFLLLFPELFLPYSCFFRVISSDFREKKISKSLKKNTFQVFLFLFRVFFVFFVFVPRYFISLRRVLAPFSCFVVIFRDILPTKTSSYYFVISNWFPNL